MAVMQLTSAKMAILLMLFYLARLSSGQGHTPRPPEPSESSTAYITRIVPGSSNTQVYPTSYYMERTNIVTSKYNLYLNYGTGNMLYAYKMGTDDDYGSRNYLIRDDLSTSFMNYEPFGFCGKPFLDANSLTESPGLGFPARWTWLNETKYSGSVKFHKKNVDLWTYTYLDTSSNVATFHDLGVSRRDQNVLNFYFMYSIRGAGFSVSVYDKFSNGNPPDTVFDVPASCPNSELEDMQSTEYSSQTPPRPKLAESFTADITYVRSTFYINEETTKLAKLYRNYVTRKQLQVNPLGRTTNAGNYYRLLRLDQDKQYTYFEPFGSCHVTSAQESNSQDYGDLPSGPGLDQPMWGWIENAKFSGVKKFRQQKLNMWTYRNDNTSTFYSLGVSRRHPNRPVVLFQIDTYYTYMKNVTVFSKYKPGPPQESVFKIPQVCD